MLQTLLDNASSSRSRRDCSATGESLEKFIEERCVLIAHIYSRQSAKKGLSIETSIFPKRVSDFAEQEFGALPPAFLVLP